MEIAIGTGELMNGALDNAARCKKIKSVLDDDRKIAACMILIIVCNAIYHEWLKSPYLLWWKFTYSEVLHHKHYYTLLKKSIL